MPRMRAIQLGKSRYAQGVHSSLDADEGVEEVGVDRLIGGEDAEDGLRGVTAVMRLAGKTHDRGEPADDRIAYGSLGESFDVGHIVSEQWLDEGVEKKGVHPRRPAENAEDCTRTVSRCIHIEMANTH